MMVLLLQTLEELSRLLKSPGNGVFEHGHSCIACEAPGTLAGAKLGVAVATLGAVRVATRLACNPLDEDQVKEELPDATCSHGASWLVAHCCLPLPVLGLAGIADPHIVVAEAKP
jgi:hypothetical protein